MPSNFASLRNSRRDNLSKLAEQMKKEGQKGVQQDERFWKLTFDPKTKNGSAVIRFLPAPPNEETPYIRIFSHAFEGPSGNWYIENCPTSLDGRACPVCEDNRSLYKSGIESDKAIVTKRKRKLSFIGNILVVNDPANPENNGKRKLYKYGSKIHDMIKSQIEPEHADITPQDPFDMWEGCNFRLRSRDDKNYLTYDKSTFDAPSAVYDNDEALEELYNQLYPLEPLRAEDQFKSYEELEKRFNQALNTKPTKSAADKVKAEQDDEFSETQKQVEKSEKKQQAKRPVSPAERFGNKKETTKAPTTPSTDGGDDEDVEAFFRQMHDE